jgi:hypothetical protein
MTRMAAVMRLVDASMAFLSAVCRYNACNRP